MTIRPSLLVASLVPVLFVTTSVAQEHYPGQHWEQLSSPDSVGWSSAKLGRAREYADSIGMAAVMIINDGRILAQWGDTSRRFKAHSMRKSLLSALYGIHVHEGHIDLDATLEQLGIDDKEPLTPTEKQATVRHLLQARSGIYRFLGGDLDAPAQGSHAPGTFYYYNNWDFDALGTIFEQLTQKKIFEEFKSRIADPLGMEDFRVEDGSRTFGGHYEHRYTRFFRYPFRISARDLSRFGLMFLRQGRWRGEQIVPAEWIEESTTPYSREDEWTRFGYAIWRIYLEGFVLPDGSRLAGDVYWTSGLGVHRLYVVPWLDLVVVHRVNTDLPGDRPSLSERLRLLAMIIDAKITDRAEAPIVDAKITDLGEALIEAARDGELAAVRTLLEGGADIHATDPRGRTVLHYAAGRNHTSVVRALLEGGADVNAPGLGRTPLHYAADRGHTSVVGALLEGGADVNASDRLSGRTALHIAAIKGHTSVVRALLEGGADVKATDPDGRTALHWAMAWGKTSMVRALLDASATLDVQEARGGETPLMWGSLAAQSSVAVQALLEAGAGVNARGKWYGETALMWAALSGDTAIARTLLESGADVGVTSTSGRTALTLAEALGHTHTALLLASANAGDGEPPAMLPPEAYLLTSIARDARSGELRDLRAAQALLSRGATISATEEPLLWAAARGDTATVQRLLRASVALEPKAKYGWTPLLLAAANGHVSVLQSLLDAGADINAAEEQIGQQPLIWAAQMGHTAAVRVLLDAGAAVDARDRFGGTALTRAADAGRTASIEVLIRAGADINAHEEVDGDTPLLEAAWSGHIDAMRALLNAGADVNATDHNGRTPLMAAAQYGQDVMVRELLAAGADISRRDNFGSTALDQARTLDRTEVVKLLEEASEARRDDVEDIKNTQTIWRVIKGGFVFDPDELRPERN